MNIDLRWTATEAEERIGTIPYPLAANHKPQKGISHDDHRIRIMYKMENVIYHKIIKNIISLIGFHDYVIKRRI